MNNLERIRIKGMNQGIWLAVQELAHDGRWTQAAEELVSTCGLTEEECRNLQKESGSFDDEMKDFIDKVFGSDEGCIMIFGIEDEDMDDDSESDMMKDIDHTLDSNSVVDTGIGEPFVYKKNEKKYILEACDVTNNSCACEKCFFLFLGESCENKMCLPHNRKDGKDVVYKRLLDSKK